MCTKYSRLFGMADSEFEEFRRAFDIFVHCHRPTTPFYSLVPNVGFEDDSPTQTNEDFKPKELPFKASNKPEKYDSPSQGTEQAITCAERRRRKLPEIPKQSKIMNPSIRQPLSLAEELGTASGLIKRPTVESRSLLMLKCGYILDEDSSPDSEKFQSIGDIDSGHSTAHSPIDAWPKSSTPTSASEQPNSGSPSCVCSNIGMNFATSTTTTTVSQYQLEMLEATHRGLHKFFPRHHDEIEIEIGDPVYVQKEAEDFWCEGVNLRTGHQGIFPSAYAVDLEFNDFDTAKARIKRERYLLGYVGSVETLTHKGTGVVCQAVKKITGNKLNDAPAKACVLEVSDQGIRMVDRSKPKQKSGPHIDYFYSLKNVSFCAFHPKDNRYLGFITKHPTLQRFACHVFRGKESTRPVAEAVGRAFQRFYQKFIETAYPIEDIYIE